MRWMISLGFGLAAIPLLATAQDAVFVSEQDFLSDLPVVLSVSRLPQRLEDTPGALTVIDRDFIRRSGARDVAELFRYVPGFQVSEAFEGDAPQASYHGALNALSGRIQLLIDGRSAYSNYLFGSISPGLQTVALQDIERIEVLRGSNSAAYGARAFLGVINIITRDPVDSRGWQASLTRGQNGVRDALASFSQASDHASFRLTVDERGDDGLAGSYGRKEVRRVNLRADFRPTAMDEFDVRLGSMAIESGVGFAGQIGNPQRYRAIDATHFQLDWRRTLAQAGDLAVTFSHTHDTVSDKALLPLDEIGFPGASLLIDNSGTGRNDSVTLQHTFRLNAAARLVWGAELRREEVTSPGLYGTPAGLVTDFSRLFANMEWHAVPTVVVNAGGLFERSNLNPTSFAPRLMVNWHPAGGHTLRAGISQGYRPPSTMERSANVRYSFNGNLLRVVALASGSVQAESLIAREIGYLGEFPALGLSVDVRGFHERVGGFVRKVESSIPTGLLGLRPSDYVNAEDFTIKGLEYQLQWRPDRATRLTWSQAYAESSSKVDTTANAAPRLTSSLALMRELGHGVDLGVLHYQAKESLLPDASSRAAVSRTDVRLAKSMQLGEHRGEVSLTVQNLGAPYKDYRPEFTFERRALLTLRLEN